jgi:hypothetical protein
MNRPWKSTIIEWTEQPEARQKKIDASFFPPVAESGINEWESRHDVVLPEEMRSFLLVSDGLEAQRGEIWPLLPMREWEFIDEPCISSNSWIRYGETIDYRYLLSLGHSPSIYRHGRYQSKEEFFAASFSGYLDKVFRGEG